MTRLRKDFVSGKLLNDIDATQTGIVSVGFARLPVIELGDNDYAVVILDPHNSPEIVYVTGHVENSTSVIVERGQEGSFAKPHKKDIIWHHGPTILDYTGKFQSDIIFSFSDDFTTNATSPSFSPVLDMDISSIHGQMRIAGTTDTVIEVLKNGSVAHTLTIPANDFVAEDDISSNPISLSSDDIFTFKINTVGTGARDLTMQGRL